MSANSCQAGNPPTLLASSVLDPRPVTMAYETSIAYGTLSQKPMDSRLYIVNRKPRELGAALCTISGWGPTLGKHGPPPWSPQGHMEIVIFDM